MWTSEKFFHLVGTAGIKMAVKWAIPPLAAPVTTSTVFSVIGWLFLDHVVVTRIKSAFVAEGLEDGVRMVGREGEPALVTEQQPEGVVVPPGSTGVAVIGQLVQVSDSAAEEIQQADAMLADLASHIGGGAGAPAAEESPRSAAGRPQVLVWIIATGAAVVLASIVLLVVLLRRRRGEAAAWPAGYGAPGAPQARYPPPFAGGLPVVPPPVPFAPGPAGVIPSAPAGAAYGVAVPVAVTPTERCPAAVAARLVCTLGPLGARSSRSDRACSSAVTRPVCNSWLPTVRFPRAICGSAPWVQASSSATSARPTAPTSATTWAVESPKRPCATATRSRSGRAGACGSRSAPDAIPRRFRALSFPKSRSRTSPVRR